MSERASAPSDTAASGSPCDTVTRAAVWPLVVVLRGYQRWISPFLPPTCRFYPTCSAYAVEALQVHGPLRGIALTVWRLLRCAPWHPGGIDPVPLGRRTRASSPAGRTTDSRARSAGNSEEQAPC